jgi:hypothetical protein
MSKASAYGDEIWQVDSLPQNADRMFISLKSLKGFASGRGQRPKNSMARFCVDYRMHFWWGCSENLFAHFHRQS